MRQGDSKRPLVSAETRARFDRPTLMLTTRATGTRTPTGAVFLFSVNPNSFEYQQSARTNVQDTTGGYVVNESGMGAPTFKLAGNFGWRTRKVTLSDYSSAAPGSVRYIPRLGQQYRDQGESMNNAMRVGFVTPTPAMASRSNTQANVAGVFELDGNQAWYALRDYVLWYSENNEVRVREGKRPLELVMHDALHRLRWVVAPKNAPDLKHVANRQGVMDYQIEFTGVYDDTRPLGKIGGGLPDLWGEEA